MGWRQYWEGGHGERVKAGGSNGRVDMEKR